MQREQCCPRRCLKMMIVVSYSKPDILAIDRKEWHWCLSAKISMLAFCMRGCSMGRGGWPRSTDYTHSRLLVSQSQNSGRNWEYRNRRGSLTSSGPAVGLTLCKSLNCGKSSGRTSKCKHGEGLGEMHFGRS